MDPSLDSVSRLRSRASHEPFSSVPSSSLHSPPLHSSPASSFPFGPVPKMQYYDATEGARADSREAARRKRAYVLALGAACAVAAVVACRAYLARPPRSDDPLFQYFE